MTVSGLADMVYGFMGIYVQESVADSWQTVGYFNSIETGRAYSV